MVEQPAGYHCYDPQARGYKYNPGYFYEFTVDALLLWV